MCGVIVGKFKGFSKVIFNFPSHFRTSYDSMMVGMTYANLLGLPACVMFSQ